MKLRHLLYVATLAALPLAAACGAKTASTPAVPPDALADARFYTGTLGNEGVFVGKLIREKGGHKYALAISGDADIHPLLPGDANVMAQLKAMPHGAAVSINGKLYPDLGVIVVGGVAAKP